VVFAFEAAERALGVDEDRFMGEPDDHIEALRTPEARARA
jgi:hypothetical protein